MKTNFILASSHTPDSNEQINAVMKTALSKNPLLKQALHLGITGITMFSSIDATFEVDSKRMASRLAGDFVGRGAEKIFYYWGPLKRCLTADIIIIPGGDARLLHYQAYREFGGNWQILKEAMFGKVIYTWSAGTNFLGSGFYSNDENMLMDLCTGILTIKTFCHYEPYKAESLDTLFHYKNQDFLTVPIGDGQYVEFSK